MKKALLVIFILLLFSFNLKAQTLNIYGGRDHDVFLGCLNCSNFEQTSIWNSFGKFGSKFNQNSIWNKFGTYGSKFSQYSPWNQYAPHPPVVVDPQGNFYGYLTVNRFNAKRADFKLAMIMYEYHEFIADDVGKWYNKIFY